MKLWEKAKTKKHKIGIIIWIVWMTVMLYRYLGLIVALPFATQMWLGVAWAIFGLAWEKAAWPLGFLPLSPVMQAIDDEGADDAPWYKGPRSIVFTICALFSIHYGWVVWQVLATFRPFAGMDPGLNTALTVLSVQLAVAVPAGLWLWNFFHWTRPERYDA